MRLCVKFQISRKKDGCQIEYTGYNDPSVLTTIYGSVDTYLCDITWRNSQFL